MCQKIDDLSEELNRFNDKMTDKDSNIDILTVKNDDLQRDLK